MKRWRRDAAIDRFEDATRAPGYVRRFPSSIWAKPTKRKAQEKSPRQASSATSILYARARTAEDGDKSATK